MKKNIFICLMSLAVLFFIGACSSEVNSEPKPEPQPQVKECTITYVTDKGTVLDTKTVNKGYVLTEMDFLDVCPDGAIFEGWNKAAGFEVTVKPSGDGTVSKVTDDYGQIDRYGRIGYYWTVNLN